MRLLALLPLFVLAACSSQPSVGEPPSPPASPARVGVLVMAHGGSGEWNAAVAQAAESVRETAPTAVAFGMADPVTLTAALDSLRDQDVDRVAVVRVFVSGGSFLEQTEYLLGLREAPPAFFIHHGAGHGSGHTPGPIDHGMEVVTHTAGLVDGSAVKTILLDRAREISQDPANESVLVLAHGMGDPGLNAELLAGMNRSRPLLLEAGFAVARMETLREDWPEARQEAEARIRGFVQDEGEKGNGVLVLPLRLSGPGPYVSVLEGLTYRMGRGLLPHAEIGQWIEETARALICGEGWPDPWERCGAVAESLH